MRKSIIITSVILTTLIGAITWTLVGNKKTVDNRKEATNTELPVAVTVISAEMKILDSNLRMVGTAEANREVMVAFEVTGSITIITEKFDSEKNSRIESLEKTITINEEMIEKQKAARYPSQTMINVYQSGIDQTAERINSLRETTPDVAKYEGRNGSDILTVVARCTYSADEPITNKRITETFDFYLSPDGTKCYSQKRVKE